eukprot:5497417-Amphidinium_carterae.1
MPPSPPEHVQVSRAMSASMLTCYFCAALPAPFLLIFDRSVSAGCEMMAAATPARTTSIGAHDSAQCSSSRRDCLAPAIVPDARDTPI